LKKPHITLNQLKSCPEFSGLSDEMAQKMLDSIGEFCFLVSQHDMSAEIRQDLD